MNDYIFSNDNLFYKHHISKNLACDTYSLHTHSTYELLYFVGGDATFVIEDRRYKLKKGDLILIRPLQYHFIQIDSPVDYERYDILFDAERHKVQNVTNLPQETVVVNLDGNSIVQDIFKKCDFYHSKCSPEVFSELLTHLLCELFYNISLFPQAPSDDSTVRSPMLSDALTYINQNILAPLTVESVANQLFVSESYLFRLFKTELHQTPKKYIMIKKLLVAQKMLTSGEKPTVVAEKCGFSDYTSFYRNYIEHFDRRPSDEVH